MRKVLVAEDEATIRDFIVINLKRAGYETAEASNGKQALEIYDNAGGNFDVAILDIMMPEMDGLELCKQLRKRSPGIGIIFLTAKTQEIDKITGLMVGADDYVTKPFSPAELMARVDVLHRRVSMNVSPNAAEDEITLGRFTLNTKNRTFTKDSQPIILTQVEFQMMEYFFKNPDSALNRDDILEKIWGHGFYGDKIVDVNIRRLRMKVEDDPSNPQHLMTVWGFGYKWVK